MQLIHWLTAAFALTGVVLNIRRHVACFYIWTATNATWAVVDWSHGLHAQACLMAVYFALSLWGIWQWTQPKKGDFCGKANSS